MNIQDNIDYYKFLIRLKLYHYKIILSKKDFLEHKYFEFYERAREDGYIKFVEANEPYGRFYGIEDIGLPNSEMLKNMLNVDTINSIN